MTVRDLYGYVHSDICLYEFDLHVPLFGSHFNDLFIGKFLDVPEELLGRKISHIASFPSEPGVVRIELEKN